MSADSALRVDPVLAHERHLDAIADRLADKVMAEPRETDPELARLQDARDHTAALGDFALADAHDRLLDLLRTHQRGPAAPPSQRTATRSTDREIGD